MDRTQLDVEMRILGNLILDNYLNHHHVKPEWFAHHETTNLLKAICLLKDKGEQADMILADPSKYHVRVELISKCTDVGINTIDFDHNVQTLKKLYANNLLKSIPERVKDMDYLRLPDNIRAIKEIIAAAEVTAIVEDTAIVNSETEPYEPDYDTSGYVPTGFPKIDYALNMLAPNLVTLVTGRSHDGKTTWVRQVIANAIEKRNRVLWVMGEGYIENERERLYEILIGGNNALYDEIIVNLRRKKIPNAKARKAIVKWENGNLDILHKTQARLKDTDQLFDLIEKYIKVKHPKLIVIDNLMSMLSSSAAEKLEKQAEFMQKCCDLAKIYHTHIILIVHPNKTYKQGDNMSFEHVSGTSDLTNKADNVIVIRKEIKEENLALGIHGHIDVIKNRIWGNLAHSITNYDKETQSLIEINEVTGDAAPNEYSLSKYVDVELNFYNGEKQVIERGTGYKPQSQKAPF